MKKKLFVCLFILYAFQLIICNASSIDVDQLRQNGYVEFCDKEHGAAVYNDLYTCFDEFVLFLQTHPTWKQKLYRAQERFIRSKNKNYYSTNFFGLYDESAKSGRNQLSFYYSIHFHEFISFYYPEVNTIPQIVNFLQACCAIQKPYGNLFQQVARDLGLPLIFSSDYDLPPILLKIVQYLPDYMPQRPHYDGTVFSLFLDSTDNESLLVAPYASSLQINDFLAPARKFERLLYQNSILLVPGCLLTEFGIYPTPHIVTSHGATRYATIAFAMRPDYVQKNNELAALPLFKIE